MGVVASALIDWFEAHHTRPIVVASHPRSGTHLLLDTLRRGFLPCAGRKRMGESLAQLYFNLDSLEALSPRQAVALAGRSARPLFKTHALADLRSTFFSDGDGPWDTEMADWLRGNATWLYAYRDGRTVLCSLHEMMRTFAEATRVPFAQFIRQQQLGASRPARWARHVSEWMMQPGVFCVAMEELQRFAPRVLPGVAEWLALEWDRADWSLPRRPRTLFGQRLTRLFSRRPSSTGIISFGRPSGDWRATFAAGDRAFFLAQAPSMLVRLGYEESPAWADPLHDADPGAPAGFWAQRN